MDRSLVQLYQDVQQDNRGDIEAYFAALDQLSANKRLETLSEQYHFKTFYHAEAFGGWRVMLGQDLAELMYGTRDVSGLVQLFKRYNIELIDLRASVYDIRSIKAHFSLPKTVSQQSFATWKHFLYAGMKGETPLAQKVNAYVMAMEREGRIQEEIQRQDMSLGGLTVNALVDLVGQSIAQYVPQMINAQMAPVIQELREEQAAIRQQLEEVTIEKSTEDLRIQYARLEAENAQIRQELAKLVAPEHWRTAMDFMSGCVGEDRDAVLVCITNSYNRWDHLRQYEYFASVELRKQGIEPRKFKNGNRQDYFFPHDVHVQALADYKVWKQDNASWLSRRAGNQKIHPVPPSPLKYTTPTEHEKDSG